MEFTVSKADLVRELSLSQGVVENVALTRPMTWGVMRVASVPIWLESARFHVASVFASAAGAPLNGTFEMFE